MKPHRLLLLSATCLALASCGQGGEPPKPAAAPAATPAPAPAAEAKKEEKHDSTPEVHGMPGMSELFKDDKKK